MKSIPHKTEVKPGYKQTEVGLIPEEWEVKRLGELATIRDGTHQTPKYVSSGIPFFSVEQVTSGDFTNTKYISEEAHRFLTRSVRIEKGDILMTRIGSIGDCKLIDWDVEASFYVSLALLKIRKGCSAAFIAHYSNSAAFKAEVELHSLQSAIPKKINLGPISDVKIALPLAETEQRAIAEVLSDVDALLRGLDRLIVKKRDLKQAAMQQLLTGQTRLPGFSRDWEVKRVLELGEVVTGGTPRTDVEVFWGNGYPWITPTDISTHRDMFTSERTLTQKGLNAIRALPANSVLVTCIASIGKNAILRTVGGCNQQINAVTPNKNNNVEFLYYMFEASKEYILANAGTTATSILSKAAFAQLMFKVPRLAEQIAIAEVLTDMDTELAALEGRWQKTRAVKRAMMQELLTGKTRLV